MRSGRNGRRILLAVFCGLCSAASARAQTPPHWRFFTSTDGLRESWVEDVSQGPGGRVWITHGGVDALTVFDGYTFRRLAAPGTSLKVREGPTGQAWALLTDPERLHSYRGLQLLEGNRWIPYPLDRIAGSRMTRSQFLPWHHDRVLFLTPEALLEFDRERQAIRTIARAADTRLSSFTDLAPASDGGAWVGGSGGLLHVRHDTSGAMPDRSTEYLLPRQWRAERLLKIHDSGESLFVSAELPTHWALLGFDRSNWTTVAASSSRSEIVEGWSGHDGTRWLAFLSPRRFRLTRDVPGCCQIDVERVSALSGSLNAVEPSAGGGFWLATSLGLVRHAPAVWRTPAELIKNEGHVGSLLQAKNGELYALHDSGLLRRTEDRWRLIPTPDGFAPDVGLSSNLGELPDGRLVLGVNRTRDRLQYGPDACLAFDRLTGRFSEIVHPAGRTVRLASVGATRIFVVTHENGRGRLETYDGRQFAEILDVGSRWIATVPRTVVELGGGGLLVVPEQQGVGWWRNGSYQRFGGAEGYPGTGAFSALALDHERYWFGDRDSIIEFSGGRWTVVRSGLETVRSIVRTLDGTIWVASGSGLHRYAGGSWLTIAAPEGLPDGGVYDVLEERDGTLWVSTTAGLSQYFPPADRDPPQTLLAGPENPAEAPPSGEVHIVFSGRDRWEFTPRERLLFSWRLDEGSWSALTPEPSAGFTALPAGPHLLEVRAVDRHWNVDPSPPRFEFVVLLPWYREPGFMIVGVLGALALATAIGLFVTRHVRLERLVAQRTAALAEVNDRLRADLAERQRMEEERVRLERQLHQSQKLEAVGRLAGGIAHDFNNLLTVISGFAGLLRSSLTEASPSWMPVDEIDKASERAARLTRQLLAFSRNQVVQPRPLDLNDVVSEIERMLRRLIGEDIDLRFIPGAGLWQVLADRGQIEQVIVNLAVNARDAMPKGGRLTLASSNTEVDAAVAGTQAGLRPGQYVLLTVTDNGIGMDADTRARIFEPYFTTKDRTRGSGFGLATVYGIVTQAGGHVSVYSEPNRGTTFKIYLPRTEAGPEPATADRRRPVVHGSETVLLVEDDDAVRRVTMNALRSYGYIVHAAASGEAALAAFSENRTPDLVLTDVVLPGMSGPQLAENLRRVRPDLRVLFMSGYVDSTAAHDRELLGEAPFLQKPFTAEALARKVRETLDEPPRSG